MVALEQIDIACLFFLDRVEVSDAFEFTKFDDYLNTVIYLMVIVKVKHQLLYGLHGIGAYFSTLCPNLVETRSLHSIADAAKASNADDVGGATGWLTKRKITIVAVAILSFAVEGERRKRLGLQPDARPCLQGDAYPDGDASLSARDGRDRDSRARGGRPSGHPPFRASLDHGPEPGPAAFRSPARHADSPRGCVARARKSPGKKKALIALAGGNW